MTLQNIDPEDFDVSIAADVYMIRDADNDTYDTISQTILVRVAAREVDFIISDIDTFATWANNDYFLDLTEVLTSQQLEAYSQDLLYVERAVLELEILDTDEATAAKSVLPVRDPSALDDPVPVALVIPKTSKLFGSYTFLDTDIAFGIIQNTAHLDTTLAFLDYLME